MSRKQSTFFETYYVYNEGARYMVIFRDQEDLDTFCSLINEYAEKNRVTIFAYNLCESCYHMLIRAERGNFDDISNFLKLVCARYGRFFNRKSFTVYNKKRHGVLFAAKFESTPINNIDELKKSIIDIHKQEELTLKKLENYAYCSYGKYLNNKAISDKGININMSYFEDISKNQFIKLHDASYIEENRGIDVHQGDYFMSYGIFVRKNNSN